MSGETERLIVALEARYRDFERGMLAASRSADRGFGQIERRAQQSAKRMEASLKGSVANINGILGAVGAGIGFRELTRLSDSYTTFTNQLRVAGREGEALAASQNKLFAIAQRYGVQLEAVGTLYGRNAAAAKELGLSEEQQLRIVEATSAALKVSGASAQSASGALLQLSQALGGPIIQAQEYNSLLDGARPLLQAVAAGSDRWGGSVAKLTADVKAGKVATADFVQALLQGSQGVIDQAATATMTFSGATTVLTNALTKFIGEMDQASGVGQFFTGAIIGAANNLPAVTTAAAAAAAVISSQYVPGLARAALAQTAMVATNPFLLMATAIGGASFALAAFGDELQPVQGELATLADYSAVAWDDIKAGASAAATYVQEAFLNLANFISAALGGAEVSMEDLANFAKSTANILINSFVLVKDVLVTSFSELPAAIAEAVLNAFNGLIASVESAINTVIGAVNAAVDAINTLGGAVGVELGKIGDVSLGRIQNSFAGAGQSAGQAYIEALRKTTRDRVGEALGSMQLRANERAAERERLKAEEANKPGSADVANIANVPAAADAKPEKANAFDRELQSLRERTALLLVEAEARRNATGSYEEQEAAVERARIVHELLNTAQREGIEITDEVRASVESMADAYVTASQEAKALGKQQREAAKDSKDFARQQEQVNDQLRDLESTGSDAMKGLIKDMISGKSPAEALANAIGKIADKLIDMALNQMFDGLFAGTLTGGSGGGNGLGSIFGSMFSGGQQSRSAVQLIAQSTPTPPIPMPTTGSISTPVVKDMAAKVAQEAIAKLPTPTAPTMSPLASPSSFAAKFDPTKIASTGKLGNKLTRIYAADGTTAMVDAQHAQKFQGLLDDLSAQGYKNFRLDQGGGYNFRNIRGGSTLSRHATGQALDINPAKNPMTNGKLITDLPPNVSEIAAKHGLKWGGDWTRRKDAMHFEVPRGAAPDPAWNQSQAAQAAQAQQQALQQQLEVQRQLQQQTQMTTGSLQTMPPSLAGVQTGMQGLEGGLAGMVGQLSSAVPGVGQFSGAIQSLMQQMASAPGGGGFGGLFSGLLGFAEGGHVSGPGTGTSDSILAAVSNGEFVVNAKSTKRHRAALEAINSGRVPAFAKGGFVGGNFANSNTYSPTLNVNVNGMKGGNAMAGQIAKEVGRTLDQARPDNFRKSDGQQMAEAHLAMQRAARRNG